VITAEGKLLLLAMGGTIAFSDGPGGAVPDSNGEELLAAVPRDSVDSRDLAKISSVGIEDRHLLQLVDAIEEGIEAGYGGIVVTHGTDTIEETAYFLALTLERGRVPLVLTAAMRHNGRADSDGPANLQAAFRVARDGEVREAGPVVVFADEIHPARFVTKAHGASLAAFRSSSGPLGEIIEDRVILRMMPSYTDYLGSVRQPRLPRVELAAMAIGADPRALRALLGIHPDGIVIEGLGAGHLPPSVVECVEEAVGEGIAVVIASRCGDGPTLQNTYGMPGGEIDLQARGAVMAGTLSAAKARLRLAVALANEIPVAAAFPVP
jgi:L-asparaginase